MKERLIYRTRVDSIVDGKVLVWIGTARAEISVPNIERYDIPEVVELIFEFPLKELVK